MYRIQESIIKGEIARRNAEIAKRGLEQQHEIAYICSADQFETLLDKWQEEALSSSSPQRKQLVARAGVSESHVFAIDVLIEPSGISSVVLYDSSTGGIFLDQSYLIKLHERGIRFFPSFTTFQTDTTGCYVFALTALRTMARNYNFHDEMFERYCQQSQEDITKEKARISDPKGIITEMRKKMLLSKKYDQIQNYDFTTSEFCHPITQNYLPPHFARYIQSITRQEAYLAANPDALDTPITADGRTFEEVREKYFQDVPIDTADLKKGTKKQNRAIEHKLNVYVERKFLWEPKQGWRRGMYSSRSNGVRYSLEYRFKWGNITLTSALDFVTDFPEHQNAAEVLELLTSHRAEYCSDEDNPRYKKHFLTIMAHTRLVGIYPSAEETHSLLKPNSQETGINAEELEQLRDFATKFPEISDWLSRYPEGQGLNATYVSMLEYESSREEEEEGEIEDDADCADSLAAAGDDKASYSRKARCCFM